MNNYIQIGYTKKTHGVNGELKIVIEEENCNWFNFGKIALHHKFHDRLTR